MSSESFRQQMDSFSSVMQLLELAQRRYARGLTLISLLLSLAGGEGQLALNLLSDGSLEEQAAWAEVPELRATANFSCW
jgi:hypothetical protein